MFTRITGETFQSMSNIADTAQQHAKPPSDAIHWLPLSGNHEKEELFARISPEDADRCEALVWRPDPRKHTTYAKANVQLVRVTGVRYWTTVYLHRFIAQPPLAYETHHLDLDGLNCVRSNLANVTHAVNMFERGPGPSGFYGVSGFRKKFRAQITVFEPGKPSRNMHIGIFSTAYEAALAYDTRARELYGPYVRCNFPLEND